MTEMKDRIDAADLVLYDTMTREKRPFQPIDPERLRMYVCGPTVYDFAHIGNARPVIVFDLLFRLLRHLFGEERVRYVRNLTDVDDKINKRALETYGDKISKNEMSLNEAIREVTESTARQFQTDMHALGCLDPSNEPRATEHISQMIEIIQLLIDRGHAYVATGAEGDEVLFRVESMSEYGSLSNRKLEEQQAGARVDVEDHKDHPGDFVLWKASDHTAPGWDASYVVDGEEKAIFGRPGWHIECSAMSREFLGETFDIHGGGIDLVFPHHENEIAQTCCAFGVKRMANTWMHNGFLQVEGEKMSKSLGNFITVDELLRTETVGGRSWPGEVIRLAMLMTQYREPIDFSVRRLEEAESVLRRLQRRANEGEDKGALRDVVRPLLDDLNTPEAIRVLSDLSGATLAKALTFFGLPDKADVSGVDEAAIAVKISERLSFIAEKNWAEADKIRDALLTEGIRLKDGKDPETGERTTHWEMV
ncbi:MAG: cysteine--tRNA ligase [Pseudomonadota bacterium]